MPKEPRLEPTFSGWRKFRIGLNVFLIVIAVLAVVVMVNYLSRDYYRRWQWSRTKAELSPRTLGLLHSLTNQVKVFLYYDKKEPLYSIVLDLLNQYCLACPKISVQIIDYVRDPACYPRAREDRGKQLCRDTEQGVH